MNPRRRLITAAEAALLCGVQRATIRDWVRRRELDTAATHLTTGTSLFLEVDVLRAERRIRNRRARA